MPVETSRDGRLCVMRCHGEYAIAELKAGLDGFIEDPELPADARFLLDMRGAESVLRSTPARLRDVATYFARRASHFGHRCALVVEGTLVYGLMRMASSWIEYEGVEARVFRDTEPAREWLLAPAPPGTRETD